ncbi:MAG: hypothetical protein PGN07_06280 [Aeromicrobium erythreum]
MPTADGAYLVRPGSVIVEPHLAGFAWDAVRQHAERRRRNGSRLRPDEEALLQVLRRAAGEHLRATPNGHRGHVSRSGADMAPSSELTTKQAAEELNVSTRHYRRLANAANVSPLGRNRWHRDDHLAITAHWKDAS